MKATVYLSRKLLNQLKVKETESKDLMLTHNLHNIIINGKRVGCSGHIQNVLNNKCVYISTEKSCYGTHTKKNGSVNVEFKTPSRGGKKSASLKKLKIIKTISPMHSAWTKVS